MEHKLEDLEKKDALISKHLLLNEVQLGVRQKFLTEGKMKIWCKLFKSMNPAIPMPEIE